MSNVAQDISLLLKVNRFPCQAFPIPSVGSLSYFGSLDYKMHRRFISKISIFFPVRKRDESSYWKVGSGLLQQVKQDET